jgi:hypothetical protein
MASHTGVWPGWYRVSCHNEGARLYCTVYCQYRRTVTKVPTRLHINLLASHSSDLSPLVPAPRTHYLQEEEEE